jgi:glutamate formiminotransferase
LYLKKHSMMLSKQPGRLSKCFVACNVYVSAGLPQHGPFLLQLLDDAQDLCRRSKKSHDDKIAIVHAFADGPYDRSSFHVAGSPNLVTDVASMLATRAVKSLSALRQASMTSTGNTAHPTVGLVDHVAVLPLSRNEDSLTLQEWNEVYGGLKDDSTKNGEDMPPSKTIPSGWVARDIGHALESAGVNVFFYGHAHANQIPLATVRRESTQFFRSLPSSEGSVLGGQATVGAPMHFNENYNIRLTSQCTKAVAQSLTKFVRERDGGLLFVEALTLPYSQNRFEVACNLLHPRQTSTSHIAAKMQEWEESHGNLVETAYRVGTTEIQCLEALEQTATTEGEKEYNRKVRERLEGYLSCSSNNKI